MSMVLDRDGVTIHNSDTAKEFIKLGAHDASGTY
jgi:hypothetical protein